MDIAEGRAISFSTVDGLTLEAVLHLPDPSLHPSPITHDPLSGIVVCHPHPQYGGDMRNNVVAILCEAAVSNGIAAMRFNFRGVGGSAGAFDNGIGEQRDVAAAFAHLRSLPEVDADRVALAGYSFGAAIALRAVDRDARALIAVSTPTISGAISQINVECPLLLVSGDRDEYSDPDALASFAETAGAYAELIILPGVDHFWWGSDDRLATIVSAFLSGKLVTAGRPP
jgi:alpha/beta superfamily hydrolase